MMFKWIAAFFSLCTTCLAATEFSPWFGPVYVVEGRATAWYEGYPSVNARHGGRNHSASNGFLDVSASIATPEGWAYEVEAIAAATRHRSLGMDSLLLTGRYHWCNDIVGDPFSLSGGLTAIKVFKPAWHDLSVFHHGGIECEAHVAVGKEFSCMQFWMSRIWAVAALGVGDVGSPWLRGDVDWEHNWWDRHQVRLFAHSVWGLGGNSLNLDHRFKGYGSISHQSIDTGLRYSYFFEMGLTLHLEYAYRVYAKNCPQHASFATIGFLYPFGL